MKNGNQESRGRFGSLPKGLGFALLLLLAGCGGGGSSSSSSPSSGSGTTLTSITVSPSAPSVGVGSVQKFTATGKYSDNSTQDLTSSATWSSSPATVATVQTGKLNPGVATGVAAGTATITASSGAVSGSTTLAVTTKLASINAIAVTPAAPSVVAGSSLKLKATGTRTDGTSQDVTSSATWTSSDPTKAAVQTSGQSSPGQVSGIANGSATITASYNGTSGSTLLTVTGTLSPLTSITVNPPTVSVITGSTQQYSALGTYADNSTQDVTRTVTWSTSNSADVTIQSASGAKPGLATAVATGSVLINASLNGISGAATLIVTDSSALFSATPIMDMPENGGGCLTYKGFIGGLYENCSNDVPTDHDADGKQVAAQVQPLDTNGNPSSSGKIVLTSIGMSAASEEFSGFVTVLNGNTALSSNVQVINGAQSNQDACYWFPAYGPPACDTTALNNYDRVNQILTNHNLSPLQVQAVWLKESNGRTHPDSRGCSPAGSYCLPLCDQTLEGCANTPETSDALNLEQELANTVRAAKQRWPNLKFIFLASRVYAGYASAGAGSPEPFAYETGFAVKWLVQAQVDQIRGLGTDVVAGDLSYDVAPWIGWGPYWWADGPHARSDGLAWCDGGLSPTAPCNGEVDFQPDGEHPLTVSKQVNMLMKFFVTSPYTAWFPSTQAQKGPGTP